MNSFIPPLSDDLLLQHNFFELYPLDGGGCFINREIIGSINDADITNRIIEQNALKDFGPLDDIDFLKFEHWRTIEKSCWINRMYFIVPIAKQYSVTHEERLAKIIRQILIRFALTYHAPESQQEIVDLEARVLYSRDHDYNSHGPEFDGPADYQWFDFQPASRIIHILYAMYFMKDSPSFSAADHEIIDELVRIHARNINWAETGGNELAPGNHQALRGTALVYAAYAFRDEPEAAEWLNTAMTICNYHILNDFLPDGMLIDLSPSYHFFETWISRDAIILTKRLGREFPKETFERISHAYDACRLFRQPDGRSTVINDGYPLDLDTFIATLPPSSSPVLSANILPNAGIAIWKKDDTFMLFDCSPLLDEFSHFHGGKQAVTLFFDNKPFLSDSNCCSYDDDDFAQWFKQPEAHSTLLINGKGDSVIEGRYHWVAASKTILEPWAGNTITASMTGAAPEWDNVRWSRTVSMAANKIKI
ncbi:MAG: alginate lyase family protein, partial [Victivallales bacterium]|nr:alginate lyase family protein [Victivallales bacterium]